MVCSDILTSALKLLGETGSATDNPDYSERAPYIIAAFIGEVYELEHKYRVINGYNDLRLDSDVKVPMNASFPLLSRFTTPCILYLASLLISDENPELSEHYYERYCDCICKMEAALPCVSEDIVNVYP